MFIIHFMITISLNNKPKPFKFKIFHIRVLEHNKKCSDLNGNRYDFSFSIRPKLLSVLHLLLVDFPAFDAVVFDVFIKRGGKTGDFSKLV
jgi:hypothetical protein